MFLKIDNSKINKFVVLTILTMCCFNFAVAQAPTSRPNSYTALLPYILPSPDQNQGEWGGMDSTNASTCLQMASTGAVEMLMNMDVPLSERLSDGSTDLSERWLFAAVKRFGPQAYEMDQVKLFNYYNGGLLNTDYRFTIGMVGDSYTVKYNWLDLLPEDWKSKVVKTPTVSTKHILGELDITTRWDVNVVAESKIEEIKQALIKYQGPVLVMINSEEFWHAVLIVGYDDEDTSVGECPYVKDAMNYLRPDHALRVRKGIKDQGGCRKKGVFYVRDSEFYDSDLYVSFDRMYDYDLEEKGEERSYVTPYLKRSYDWMKFLGNYATVVYRADVDSTMYPPKK